MTRRSHETLSWRLSVASAPALVLLCSSARAETLPPTPVDPAPPQSVEECIEHHRAAQVERRRGHLVASGQELRRCLSPECSPLLREACDALLTEVAEATPSVVFSANSGDRALTEVSVFDGDAPVATTLDGRAIELDPGEHHFRFEAPAMATASLVVVLRVGDRGHLVTASLVPSVLESSSPPAPPTSAPLPPKLPLPSQAPGAAPSAPAHSHKWDYAVLGVGGALGVAGIFLGLAARSDYHDAETSCSPFCSGSRQARIRRKDLAADSLLVLSAAATTYGVVRLFTAGKGPEKTTLSVGVGSLLAEGKF